MSNTVAKKTLSQRFRHIFFDAERPRHFWFTLIAVFMGLLAGAVVLTASGINPFVAYARLFGGVFGKAKYLTYTLEKSLPIILTGLSVAFAFKTGLFNIGAEGQFIMGALVSAAVGILVKMPPVIHALVCIAAGGLAGALWGAIAGFLKAARGISEVIVTIMLNWIAFFLSNYLCMNTAMVKPSTQASLDLLPSATTRTSWFGANTFDASFYWGTFIVLACVVIMWIITEKTTLGYRLRAVGLNRDAAKYGGIDVGRSFVVSMAIAGAFSGLAGAIQITGPAMRLTQLPSPEGYGFDGIAVAMIGANNPYGALAAGLFYGAMKYGGGKLNLIDVPSETVSVVIGSIIYFIAISSAFYQIWLRIANKKRGVAL